VTVHAIAATERSAGPADRGRRNIWPIDQRVDIELLMARIERTRSMAAFRRTMDIQCRRQKIPRQWRLICRLQRLGGAGAAECDPQELLQ